MARRSERTGIRNYPEHIGFAVVEQTPDGNVKVIKVCKNQVVAIQEAFRDPNWSVQETIMNWSN